MEENQRLALISFWRSFDLGYSRAASQLGYHHAFEWYHAGRARFLEPQRKQSLAVAVLCGLHSRLPVVPGMIWAHIFSFLRRNELQLESSGVDEEQ